MFAIPLLLASNVQFVDSNWVLYLEHYGASSSFDKPNFSTTPFNAVEALTMAHPLNEVFLWRLKLTKEKLIKTPEPRRQALYNNKVA